MTNFDYILLIIYLVSATISAVGFYIHHFVDERDITLFDLLCAIVGIFGPLINIVMAIIFTSILLSQSEKIVIYKKKK